MNENFTRLLKIAEHLDKEILHPDTIDDLKVLESLCDSLKKDIQKTYKDASHLDNTRLRATVISIVKMADRLNLPYPPGYYN
jgi:hypothetical protein